MEEAWALALDMLASPPETQEVATIVNPGHPGAEPAIDGLLKLAGWSRTDLVLVAMHLSVTATSRSSQWEPAELGPAVWTPGYRLLLRWCTQETREDKAPQPLAKGVTGVPQLCCSLDKLEVEDGVPPNRTKADATRWGCRVAWDHIKESVQPALRHTPPMSVTAGPGDKLEVAMDLRPEQVRSVVRQSSKQAWIGVLGEQTVPAGPHDHHGVGEPRGGAAGINPSVMGQAAGGPVVCRPDPLETCMHPDRQTHLAQGMWNSLHRVWEAAHEADDTNALWATWTSAVEEYFLMTEDAEGNTAKWLLQH